MFSYQTETGNGQGYLALPPSGQGPGVVLLHAWWGLNDTIKELADRLAEAGFVTLAPDLFGGRIATTIEEADVLSTQADEKGEEVQALTVGALEALRDHPAVQGDGLSLIGFSFGAAYAFLVASSRPDLVRRVVVFYGTYLVDFSTSQASYLGHFAEEDQFESLEYVKQVEDALRQAGREVSFYIYPEVKHWFFEPDRPEHDPQTAALVWQRTLDFLRSGV